MIKKKNCFAFKSNRKKKVKTGVWEKTAIGELQDWLINNGGIGIFASKTVALLGFEFTIFSHR